jgi:hypothetical protein
VHDQADTNVGVRKHLADARRKGTTSLVNVLIHAEEVSRRPDGYFRENPDSNPETLLDGKPYGCDTQLWAIGARKAYLLAS